MGKPAECEGIAILLFISSYLAVMATEKPSVHPCMAQHLYDQMGDAELYGWELVRACHAVWLHQQEQVKMTWVDVDAKIKYRRALVCYGATGTSVEASAPLSNPKESQQETSRSTMCLQSRDQMRV